MRKPFIVVGIVCLLGIASFGLMERTEKHSMSTRLKEILNDVYAPQSMQQFLDSMKSSEDILEPQVTDRLYVAFGNELSEEDKQRVCETYIYHGAGENQKDGKERYLAKTYLYSTKGAEPIKKNFVFVVGESGKVEDFRILDTEL